MRLSSVGFVLVLLLAPSALAQGGGQTVRGVVMDGDTRVPLVGATVVVADSEPLIGAATDADFEQIYGRPIQSRDRMGA